MDKTSVAFIYILMKLNKDGSITIGQDKHGKKFMGLYDYLIIEALEELKIKEGKRWDNAFVMEFNGTYQLPQEDNHA